MIAILVSKSGGWISANRPHSNRDRSLSSMFFMSLGNLSLVMTICFRASYRVLKVWKNSSTVLSFPAINCMSSINRISVLFLYLFLNSTVLSFKIACMTSFVNCSDETYRIEKEGCRPFRGPQQLPVLQRGQTDCLVQRRKRQMYIFGLISPLSFFYSLLVVPYCLKPALNLHKLQNRY